MEMWESRQRREIPTFPQPGIAPDGKVEKPKRGFPLSHAGLATTTTVCLYLEPNTKKGDRPLRGLLLTFQDHLVLETEPDFRIILRLENALPSDGPMVISSVIINEDGVSTAVPGSRPGSWSGRYRSSPNPRVPEPQHAS